eukprot:gene217-944_t
MSDNSCCSSSSASYSPERNEIMENSKNGKGKRKASVASISTAPSPKTGIDGRLWPYASKNVYVTSAPYALGQDLPGAELAPRSVHAKKPKPVASLREKAETGGPDHVMREEGLPKAMSNEGWKVTDQGDLACDSALWKKGQKRLDYLREKYDTWLASIPKEPFEEWLKEPVRPPMKLESSGACRTSYASPYDMVDHSVDVGECMRSVHESVLQAVTKNEFALQIGGDHSLGSASINAVAKKHPDLCVIWIDAHGDFNTPETSPSMHYHGMSAAHAVGLFKKNPKGFEWFDPNAIIPPNRMAYFGLRDVDYEEGQLMRDSDVHWSTMHEMDHLGVAKCFAEQMKKIDPDNNRPIHLSLDIDGLDPLYAPGTGTPAKSGLSAREVRYICTELAKTGRLVSMDLVEVNPLLDQPPQSMHGDDPTMSLMSPTVQRGCELILACLGKQLLPGVSPKKKNVGESKNTMLAEAKRRRIIQ